LQRIQGLQKNGGLVWVKDDELGPNQLWEALGVKD
jgi:hypothetical protein